MPVRFAVGVFVRLVRPVAHERQPHQAPSGPRGRLRLRLVDRLIQVGVLSDGLHLSRNVGPDHIGRRQSPPRRPKLTPPFTHFNNTPLTVALRHRVSIMSLANEIKKKGTMFFEVILPHSDSIVSEAGII